MTNRFFDALRKRKRFREDVPYDLAVPPFGLDFYHMTVKQAKENYRWFLSNIPDRMAYFRNRCASDLKIPEDSLDYSAASLIPVWRWFLQTARIEKTPREELERMKEGAKTFGESWINREQFTVATRFIMRDVGIYVGECFVRNHPQLQWAYNDKPKNYVDGRQPVISGFRFRGDDGSEGDMVVNPIRLVEGAGAEFFSGMPKETDLFDCFMEQTQWIPDPDGSKHGSEERRE